MCGMLVALMGATKDHPLIKDCLDFYDITQYKSISSSYRNQSIVCDDIMLAKLWKYGLKMLDERQKLSHGIIIYTSSTFGGSITYKNKDNYAVHMCSSTWRNSLVILLKK